MLDGESVLLVLQILLSEAWANWLEETVIYSPEDKQSCTKSFEQNKFGEIIDLYFCDQNDDLMNSSLVEPFVEDIF